MASSPGVHLSPRYRRVGGGGGGRVASSDRGNGPGSRNTQTLLYKQREMHTSGRILDTTVQTEKGEHKWAQFY